MKNLSHEDTQAHKQHVTDHNKTMISTGEKKKSELLKIVRRDYQGKKTSQRLLARRSLSADRFLAFGHADTALETTLRPGAPAAKTILQPSVVVF